MLFKLRHLCVFVRKREEDGRSEREEKGKTLVLVRKITGIAVTFIFGEHKSTVGKRKFSPV